MRDCLKKECLTSYEETARRKGYDFVIGIDEAGRGPLAGPVVAAAVYLPHYEFDNPIRDSKGLSHAQREKAFHEISDKAFMGIGMVNEACIDEVNILEATFIAMNNALRDLMAHMPLSEETRENLSDKVHVLVDGNRFKTDLAVSFESVTQGDRKSMSIAGASIIAKVTRDRILTTYDKIFPQYGFSKHKGYPTAAHKQAIRKHGLSPIHRKTFRYE